MTDNYELVGSIRRSLADIGSHWEALLVQPSSAGQGGAPSARITRDDHDEAEDDLDRTTRVVSLRREVIDVLNAVSRWVMEDRPVKEALPDGSSAPSMIAFLDIHAEWIADRDAEDCNYESDRLRGLSKRVVSLVAPPRKEWHYLGACPLETETGEACSGLVRVHVGGDQSEATCKRCETTAAISWWEDELGLAVAEESVRSYDIAHMLAERLKMSVTERTIRNWARDERISIVFQFGPEPKKPNYWFNPRVVLGQVARMDRDCPMCDRVWSGEGEVCSRCYHALRVAQPRRAETKRPTPAARNLRPVRVVPDSHDTDRPERCHFSDLPIGQCACGRAHAESA